MKKQNKFFSVIGIDKLGKTRLYYKTEFNMLRKVVKYNEKLPSTLDLNFTKLNFFNVLPLHHRLLLPKETLKLSIGKSYIIYKKHVDENFQMLTRFCSYFRDNSFLLTDRSILCTAAYALDYWENALADSILPGKVIFLKYTGDWGKYKEALINDKYVDGTELKFLKHYEQIQANYERIIDKHYDSKDVLVIEVEKLPKKGVGVDKELYSLCGKFLVPHIYTDE